MKWVLRATLAIMMSPFAFPALGEVLAVNGALNVDTPLGKYLYSPQSYDHMEKAAAALDRAYGIECREKYHTVPVNLIVLSPINFPDGAGKPVEGSWMHRFDAIRCGATKRYNLMWTIQPDGSARPNLLPPGNTTASPRLIMDTLPFVRNHASRQMGQECPNIAIIDTAVSVPPHTVSDGGRTNQGVWKEQWTMQGCGKQVSVPVTFIPTENGGATYVVGK